jgi:CobQ-like glutamine amidotransferase family enzyme
MGDVVNEASNLCHDGNRGSRNTLQVSTTVHGNLNDHNKGLLKSLAKSYLHQIDQYEGEIVNPELENYLDDLKKKAEESKRTAELARGGLLSGLMINGRGW